MSRSIGPAADGTDALRQRLARYPAERYPVQHATAQFQLGMALIDAGHAAEAAVALRTAQGLFRPDQLPVEHAKTTLMLGIAQRECGDRNAAEAAFTDAMQLFDGADQPLESAAARYNLGLVLRESGRPADAIAPLTDALERFHAREAAAQAAACARELGAAQLTIGRIDDATASLQAAMDLAAELRDDAGVGAAANSLGLALLAAERIDDSVGAFEAAVAAHPRAVRPADYAMAKANLALAFQRRGDVTHAVLAARQALGVPTAPPPVAAQAAGVLDDLGLPPADVHAVLDTEPAGRWPAIVREELARWVDLPADQRDAEAAAWVQRQPDRPQRIERTEALLGGLLELPPEPMEALIRSLLAGLDRCTQEQRDDFRAATARAMPRFAMPQWMRLRETFDRLAAELGREQGWG